MAKGIYAGLSEGKSGIEKHQFVSFESFLENGWNAEIEVGSLCGTPIRNILATSNNQIHKAILDTRKSPHTSSKPIYYEPGDLWIMEKLK